MTDVLRKCNNWVSLVTNTTPAGVGYYKYKICCIFLFQTETETTLPAHNIGHIVIALDLAHRTVIYTI